MWMLLFLSLKPLIPPRVDVWAIFSTLFDQLGILHVLFFFPMFLSAIDLLIDPFSFEHPFSHPDVPFFRKKGFFPNRPFFNQGSFLSPTELWGLFFPLIHLSKLFISSWPWILLSL